MPVLRHKYFRVGLVTLGVMAVGLWYWLNADANEGGLVVESRGVDQPVLAAEEQKDAIEQEPAVAPKVEAAAGDVPVADGSGDGEPDEVWEPGGANEPTVDDVQQWNWLKDDLDRMIDRTRPRARNRIDARQFKEEYLMASLQYLNLDREEGDRFEAAVEAALTAIVEARDEMEGARAAKDYDEEAPDSVQVWKDTQAEFVARQKEAANRIAKSLPVRRRTTLMREQALRWIVRYDFGIRHANRAPSR